MRRIETQRDQWPHRTATPEHLDRKWKNDVMDAVMRSAPDNSGQHGITFRDHPGDGPTTGYMVSLPKSEGHEQHHPMDELSGKTLGDYGDRERKVINRDPRNSQGGWEQDRDWYNDVSRNYGDLWHADKDAYQGEQKAIYDLDRNRSVDTDEGGWMTGAPWITGRMAGDRDGH